MCNKMKTVYSNTKMSPEEELLMQEIAEKYSNISEWIQEILPSGRERALCITRLEDSYMRGCRSLLFD